MTEEQKQDNFDRAMLRVHRILLSVRDELPGLEHWKLEAVLRYSFETYDALRRNILPQDDSNLFHMSDRWFTTKQYKVDPDLDVYYQTTQSLIMWVYKKTCLDQMLAQEPKSKPELQIIAALIGITVAFYIEATGNLPGNIEEVMIASCFVRHMLYKLFGFNVIVVQHIENTIASKILESAVAGTEPAIFIFPMHSSLFKKP